MVYRAIPKTCPRCGRHFKSGLAYAGHRVHCLGKVERKREEKKLERMQIIDFMEPDSKSRGQFMYRCDRLAVDCLGKRVLTYIPFTGSERKCWECGGSRNLLMITSFEDGRLLEYKEVCDK